MRLRNGKVCEDEQNAPTQSGDASQIQQLSSETTQNLDDRRNGSAATVDPTPNKLEPEVSPRTPRRGKADMDGNNGPGTFNGSPEHNIFIKTPADYLAEASASVVSETEAASLTSTLVGGCVTVAAAASKIKPSNTSATKPTPMKEGSVRPHSRTVLLALKVGAWSLVVMYFLVPAIVKLNPWIMSEIAFLHRFKVPFFVDLTKPERLGLNGTFNFAIPSTDDVKLGAWHILPESLQDRELTEGKQYRALLQHGEPIIIYYHGNAGTRAVSHRISIYKVLANAGYHVIAVDYRGFGDSTGTPSEEGLVEDGLAVYDWVKKHSGKVPVYIWGHSLGSGVATQTGARSCKRGTPPSGVILDAPFTNIIDAASKHPLATPFRYMPYFTWVIVESLKYNDIYFANDKHIQDITVPILILHAEDDAVVPFVQGKMLYEAASKGKAGKSTFFINFEPQHNYGHDHIWKAPHLPRIIKDFMAGKLNS